MKRWKWEERTEVSDAAFVWGALVLVLFILSVGMWYAGTGIDGFGWGVGTGLVIMFAAILLVLLMDLSDHGKCTHKIKVQREVK